MPGKGRKFTKRILSNQLPLWATSAQRESVEYSLDLSQMKGKGLGYSVIKSLPVMLEGCSRGH